MLPHKMIKKISWEFGDFPYFSLISFPQDTYKVTSLFILRPQHKINNDIWPETPKSPSDPILRRM